MGRSGVAAAAPAEPRSIDRIEVESYVRKANRIAVRHRHGQTVAVIEIVSPGNKGSKAAMRSFVERSADLIQQGIHLLVIDLFPPGPRDPLGVHKLIWDEFEDRPFALPSLQSLTLAAYDAGERTAYVEFATVGENPPDMPIFLQPGIYVPTPLAATYAATWAVFPAPLKGLLEVPS